MKTIKVRCNNDQFLSIDIGEVFEVEDNPCSSFYTIKTKNGFVDYEKKWFDVEFDVLTNLKECLAKAEQEVEKYKRLIDEYEYSIEDGTIVMYPNGETRKILEIDGLYYIYNHHTKSFVNSFGRFKNNIRETLKNMNAVVNP